MAHEDLVIRKIIITAEVGRLPVVVGTRIRTREAPHSAVGGGRIIPLVAEGGMILGEDHLHLAPEMGPWLPAFQAIIRKTRIGGL